MPKPILPLLLLMALLAACTATPPPTTQPIPVPTSPQTNTTNNNQPTAPQTPEIEMGRTAEGAFYMGSPQAPIKFYEYSNFL